MNPKSLFLRKSTTDPIETGAQGTGLRKTLGAFDLTLLGIGAIIGAGLFSSIADMISGTDRLLGAGPAVSISFLVTAIACGFAALCYAEIAAMVPAAGSAYSYSYAAFGELVAWIIGWDLMLEYAIGNVYVAHKWAAYFQTFLDGMFGWKLPVWLAADLQSPYGLITAAQETLANGAATVLERTNAQAALDAWSAAPRLWNDVIFALNVPATLIVVLLTVILYRGIRGSARANSLMVGLKVLLVLAFLGIGVFHVDPYNWTHWLPRESRDFHVVQPGTSPFAPNGFHGIWQAAALGFFAYIGFDAVSTAAEETRNPQRNLPRGLIWSLLICTVLYVATATVLTGITHWTQIGSDDPLADAFLRMGFQGGATAFAFGAVVAMTAVLLVFQLGQTRIFMVMARDGLLPRVFSKVHPKFQTPHINTVVVGALVALATNVMTPDQAILLCNVGTLFAFILVSLGVIVLRVREPDRPRPFKVPFYPVTPILSALACAALILGLEAATFLRLLAWLALGLIVYFAYGYHHSVLRRRHTLPK